MRIRNAGKEEGIPKRRAPKFARRHNVVAASLSRGVPWAGERTLVACWSRHSAATNFDSSPFCYAKNRIAMCESLLFCRFYCSRSSRSRLQNPARSMRIPGSTRLQRVGRGILPRRTFLCVSIPSVVLRKSSRSQNCDRQHAASVRSPDLRVHA